MRIQHNIAALNSYRNLGVNNSGVAKNLEKLSSGYRINRAGDDAAGLAISEKMRSQITGLNTATKNANDGISLVQTAEGALTEVHSMLNRMVEIATQSANGVYEDGVDRQALQDEMNALTSEIDRIADGTNFNKKNLLDGSLDTSVHTIINKDSVVDPDESTNNKAGLDVDIKFADKFNDAGITVEFKATGADKPAADSSATIAAGGAITITVGTNALTGASKLDADGIAKLIKEADQSSLGGTTENQAKYAEIINSITVTGEGVLGLTGAKAFNTLPTAAPAEKIHDKKGEAMNLQIGDTNKDFNQLKVAISDMHAEALKIHQEKTEAGKTTGISVATEEKAGAAVDVINQAINTVSTQRGKLGAIQNRLEHTINNLSVNAENMTAAESRIRDVDMADEMMKYTKNNILVQASQAMLAQANQVPQGVLQLLQ